MVAFFSALPAGDGDGEGVRRTAGLLSRLRCSARFGPGIPCWGWLVSAIKWTNEGYKTIRFGFLFFWLLSALFSSLLFFASLRFGLVWFLFCAKVFYYYIYFLFLVDLWVGHFICTYVEGAGGSG